MARPDRRNARARRHRRELTRSHQPPPARRLPDLPEPPIGQHGFGLGARWLLALPFIVVVAAGQLALRAWREEPDASFGHAFAAGFGAHFWALFGVPLAVTTFFLVTRTFFTNGRGHPY